MLWLNIENIACNVVITLQTFQDLKGFVTFASTFKTDIYLQLVMDIPINIFRRIYVLKVMESNIQQV